MRGTIYLGKQKNEKVKKAEATYMLDLNGMIIQVSVQGLKIEKEAQEISTVGTMLYIENQSR